MSSLQNIRIKEAYLSSTFNDNAFNFTRAIESIDYYEDLLNPTLTFYIRLYLLEDMKDLTWLLRLL